MSPGGGGGDIDGSAQGGHPFLHAQEADPLGHSAGKAFFRRFESNTVVPDDKDCFRVAVGQEDIYAIRLGVLGDVGQAFLKNPIQNDLGSSSEAPLESGCLELDVQAVAVAQEILDMPLQGRNEAHVIQQVRPQAGRRFPDLVGQLFHPAGKRPAPISPFVAAVVKGCLQRLQAEMQGSEGLAEFIVQIRREAPAFFFHDIDQAPRQVMDLFLRFLPAGDVDDDGHNRGFP